MYCTCVARMGDERGAYRVFVGRTEGKRPLGRPRRRWENNTKVDLQEIRGHGLNLSDSRQGQLACCCECGNEPSGSTKCREFLD